MKLPLRARITAWYFAVLIVSFAAFAWICDYGFRRSIEAKVNDASRANLESIEIVLKRTAPQGPAEVKNELNELAGLWAGGALLEVANPDGSLIYQSAPFLHSYPPLPRTDSRDVSFFTTNLDRIQYRIAMHSIDAGSSTFRIRAAVATEPFDQALDSFRLILQAALPVLVVIASLTGYWLSGRALSPVNEIIKTARGVGVQNLSGRLVVPEADDELRRLSVTLNDMLARIESSVQRITRFTADASHDLRTPVALIRTSAELALRRSRTEQEYRETLTRILGTSEETTNLIENLLTLARADTGAEGLQFQRVDLGIHLHKAAENVSILAAGKGLQFEQDLSAVPAWISADPPSVDRLLLILLENAVKYTPAGGQVSLRFRNGGDFANVDVSDTGIGISGQDLPHIFERFYRADQARSREPGGSGLGLSIAAWIVNMHRGTIEARSSPGSGSVFSICLPLSKEA